MRWLAAGAALAPFAAAALVRAQAPAAERLALVRSHRLLVRSTEGQERTVLETPDETFLAYPVWSPDGSRIAHVQSTFSTVDPEGDWGDDVYAAPVAGGGPQLLFKHDRRGVQIQGLAWTPDGRGLLMGYQVTLLQDGRFAGRIERIERLEVATGERATVVENALFPSLSRDGTRIGYLTQDNRGKVSLWVAAADGADARQVSELAEHFLFVLSPRIAPDGASIAIAAVALQAAADRPIWRGRPAGSGASAPARNGTHGFPMDIWSVRVADGAVSRLTNIGEDEPYPAWSPDGATMTIMATGGLYELNTDGTNLRRIGAGEFGGQIDVR
jgi:Tol biopolymer transport system component